MQGRLGALTMWSKVTDPAAHTAPARKAALERFEREVDPDGTLPPDERARRAAFARRAYFLRLSMASAEARRARSVGDSQVVDQDVIDLIVRERGAGATLAAIADLLTAEGVPTAKGGMRWNPSMVKVLLG